MTKKPKKERKRTQTVEKWVFAQTTHVVAMRYGFAWWVAFGL